MAISTLIVASTVLAYSSQISRISLTAVQFIRPVSTLIVAVTEVVLFVYTAVCVVTFEQVGRSARYKR